MPDSVVVVIPVHDEDALLRRCLQATAAAARPLRAAGVRVRVVTVLDACTDDSGSIAQRLRHADDVVVEVDVRNVGRARGVGVAVGLDGLRGRAPWVVCGDADSVPRPCWLVDHLRLCGAGRHCVAGGIELTDLHHRPAGTAQRWLAHEIAERHRARVYGANLGIRADALAEVGGVPGHPSGEDQALWDLVGASGRPRTARPGLTVATSARARARAPHGLHRFLDEMVGAA